MDDVYLERKCTLSRQGKASEDCHVLYAEPFKLALKRHTGSHPRNV